MRTPFTGVGTALITPFTRDGSLDEAAVKRLARRQIEGGVHFLSPCGTTGEAPTLTHRDKLRVVELVVEEANGKVPVLAGALAEALVTQGETPVRIAAAVFGAGLGYLYVAGGRSVVAPVFARIVFQCGAFLLEAFRLV